MLGATPLAARQVVEVQVAPAAMTLAVGDRRPVLATLFDRAGQVVSDVAPRFTTSDSAVVVVSQGGMVTAVGPGLASVDVRVGQRGSSVAVAVRGSDLPPGMAEATRLLPSHGELVLLPGEEAEVGVAALRGDGTAIGPVRVNWVVADSAVATARGGLIRGRAPGTTVAMATVVGLRAELPVTVAAGAFAFGRTISALAPGERDTLRVIVPSQGGRVVASGLTWSSSDTTVLTITPDGEALGVAPGRAEAIVRGYGQAGGLSLLVHPPVEAVLAEPGPSSGMLVVPVGGARVLRVQAQAADGSLVPGVPVRWRVRDTTVASIDPGSGRLLGLTGGTTELSARVHGFAPLEWAVRVLPGDLVLVPGRAGGVPGEIVPMEARLLDESGTPVAAPGTARWASSDARVVALTDDGQLVARGPGRAVVSVETGWGGRASGEVLVSGALLATATGPGGGIVQGDPTAPAALQRLVLGLGPDGQPARSADGTRLAWASSRDGDVELYVADVDGRGVQRLTTSPGYDGEPAWLPSGEAVVFVSARGGRRGLWLQPLDGTLARSLGTPASGERRGPSVAPDGSAVAALAVSGGRAEVAIVSLTDGTERTLPTGPAPARAVAWLADGQLLVAREDGGRTSLLLVDPATGATRVQLESGGGFGALAAAPDGTRAALLLQRGGTGVLLLVPLGGGPPQEVPLPAGLRLQDLDLR